MRDHRLGSVLFLWLFVLATVPLALAAPSARERKEMIPRQVGGSQEAAPFEEATLYFELNDTDGDLGFHGLIDGEEWDRLIITSPDGKQNLTVTARGSLRQQGMTELFFESGEPSFDELSPEETFQRFPAGDWTITGRTLDNTTLQSVVTVRHVLPAPPGNVQISGEAAAESCDAATLPSVSGPVMISWDPVTTSHPDIGVSGTIEVERYQLVVEREEPNLLVFSVDLPPDVTSFTVPQEFIALGDAFKFEILVRDTGGNQTAVESCFEID